MNQKIKISSATYGRLEQHSEGFHQTPSDVIERLLDFYEGKVGIYPVIRKTGGRPAGRRDHTKYMFNGHSHGKNRLVLAVVSYYVENHLGVSLAELKKVFPPNIQGSLGVFQELSDARNSCTDPDRRYFMQPNELIKLSDCTIAVCTQWGKKPTNNIGELIKTAEEIGYTITPIKR